MPTLYVSGKKRHAFDREEDSDRDGDFQLRGWRWLCSCGAKGRWQYQSPNVAYHSWLTHVVRDGK